MEILPQGATALWVFLVFVVTLGFAIKRWVSKDMERRLFPTAENLKAAVTEEANLVTHMVSLLLFRLHLTPQGTSWQPCPEHSSMELLLSL